MCDGFNYRYLGSSDPHVKPARTGVGKIKRMGKKGLPGNFPRLSPCLPLPLPQLPRTNSPGPTPHFLIRMFLTQTVPRQREIIEVLLRNGWDYMRRLITLGKADEPQLPTPAVLKNILVDLGPVYVKFGQLLSTRPDLLNASYIEELSTLQDEVPAVPWSAIEIVIRQQLKRPLEETFTVINPIPVAAGSIAQTHRATLADGREVALKVQRPGIDLTIAQDIALIQGIADLVARTDFGQTYEIKSTAEEFTKALEAELDFIREADFTDQLRQNLSQSNWYDPSQIVVAKIYWDLTTAKLMVMEWLDGVPLLSANLNAEKKRQRSCRRTQSNYFASVSRIL